jgi:hypothetical protein
MHHESKIENITKLQDLEFTQLVNGNYLGRGKRTKFSDPALSCAFAYINQDLVIDLQNEYYSCFHNLIIVDDKLIILGEYRGPTGPPELRVNGQSVTVLPCTINDTQVTILICFDLKGSLLWYNTLKTKIGDVRCYGLAHARSGIIHVAGSAYTDGVVYGKEPHERYMITKDCCSLLATIDINGHWHNVQSYDDYLVITDILCHHDETIYAVAQNWTCGCEDLVCNNTMCCNSISEILSISSSGNIISKQKLSDKTSGCFLTCKSRDDSFYIVVTENNGSFSTIIYDSDLNFNNKVIEKVPYKTHFVRMHQDVLYICLSLDNEYYCLIINDSGKNMIGPLAKRGDFFNVVAEPTVVRDITRARTRSLGAKGSRISVKFALQ